MTTKGLTVHYASRAHSKDYRIIETETAQEAMERYHEVMKNGLIGFHHEADNNTMFLYPPHTISHVAIHGFSDKEVKTIIPKELW